MTDRYFENTLPDYSPEEEGEDSAVECKSPLVFDRTVGRPSRQCAISTVEFLKAALSLKDEIVRATWSPIARVSDPTTYTDIIDSCAAAAEKMEKYVTFLCGQPGIYALGAAVAKCRGDQQRLQYYLERFLEVFPLEDDFQQAAIEAAELVWKRGLLRRVEICHGVSGNAYPFLALYRLLGAKKYLHRAREFAGFLHDDNGRKHIAQGKMHGGDHPYSLFEGLAGTAHLWLDMVDPQNSRFPGFEL